MKEYVFKPFKVKHFPLLVFPLIYKELVAASQRGDHELRLVVHVSDNILVEVILNLLVLLLVEVVLLEEALEVLKLGIEDLVAEGAEVGQLGQLHDGLLKVSKDLCSLLFLIFVLDRYLIP